MQLAEPTKDRTDEDRSEREISIQRLVRTPCPAPLRRKIAADLAAGMPSFGIDSYFSNKSSLFQKDAITVIIRERATNTVIGVIVAGYLENLDLETLNIRTILIAEDWHRSNIIRLLWRNLFESVIGDGRDFPETIVFKTYSPKSFLAMVVFSRIPGVEMYPSLQRPNTASALEHVRRIAETLSPGHRLHEATGVLKGASDGVNDFYADLPTCGRREIDEHFKRHVTQSDRLLCCLFVSTPPAADRIMRAFGARKRGT